MYSQQLIEPHGGTLVNRRAEGFEDVHGEVSVPIDERAVSDLLMLGTGALSPLMGFMNRCDYDSCLRDMRLRDGTVWPLPVTLPVPAEVGERLEPGNTVLLEASPGVPVATLRLEEAYYPNKLREAHLVYGTTEPEHPGVKALYQRGDIYLAGEVRVWEAVARGVLARANGGPLELLSPRQTRAEFSKRGWFHVVGFQTRNPLHRVHEYIQKCALEIVDGLLLHPLMGATKDDDVPAALRVETYRAMLDAYFPSSRVVLAGFPAFMRYAGPREALFHALVRKNYGCSHFIVGRDHAGVGNYYDPLAAQAIFSDFSLSEMGVVPLKFEPMFYCRRCGSVASSKTCPHDPRERLQLSGTRVRGLLAAGELPPPEITRPEVARLLLSGFSIHYDAD